MSKSIKFRWSVDTRYCPARATVYCGRTILGTFTYDFGTHCEYAHFLSVCTKKWAIATGDKSLLEQANACIAAGLS